jgi:CxxC-x17-CxxC domain-containing protein
MSDFFKPRFQRQSFGKKSFGNKGRGFDHGPKEMYKATCSKCGNACEVPFRPNGAKPVLCSNCFVRDDSSSRGPRRDFSPRPSFNNDRPAPRPDQAFNDLKAELRVVNQNLERLIALMTPAKDAPTASVEPKASKKKASKAK